jgi:hypothetical protein
MGNHRTTWANLLGVEVDPADAPWEGNPVLLDGPPQPKSVCYGPLAAAAPIALSAVSTGMSIIGGANQAAAQRAQGEIAYQDALQRARMQEVQAQQLEQNAGQAEAASQRLAIEERRKGILAAGRLRAVMGASGAGIDENLIASAQGLGDYNADTALYSGTEKARGMRNEAALTRYSGQAGIQQGEFAQSADNSAADATMVGTIAKAGISFADKYGGDLFKGGSGGTGGIDSEIASWSQYGQDDLSRASLDAALQRNAGYVA